MEIHFYKGGLDVSTVAKLLDVVLNDSSVEAGEQHCSEIAGGPWSIGQDDNMTLWPRHEVRDIPGNKLGQVFTLEIRGTLATLGARVIEAQLAASRHFADIEFLDRLCGGKFLRSKQ